MTGMRTASLPMTGALPLRLLRNRSLFVGGCHAITDAWKRASSSALSVWSGLGGGGAGFICSIVITCDTCRLNRSIGDAARLRLDTEPTLFVANGVRGDARRDEGAVVQHSH